MDTVANIANNLLSPQDAAVTAALVSGAGTFASPPAESANRMYMDLPITTHFCSSCKKRMPFEAFHRRQNGNLYNTCISCLNRTKLKKARNGQNKTTSTRTTTERMSGELSMSLSPPLSSAEANNQIPGLGLRRVPTSTSNHSSNADDTTATSITSAEVSSGGLVPMQQLPLRLTLSAQPLSSPLALPTTISHTEDNEEIEEEEEEEETIEHDQEDTQSTKRPRLTPLHTSMTGSGVFIPDSYVQLEYQRIELEKQRLALEQERWREERAERMKWEQMYREQWQEEREERKAFREREQYIWKIMLALRGATTQGPSTSN